MAKKQLRKNGKKKKRGKAIRCQPIIPIAMKTGSNQLAFKNNLTPVQARRLREHLVERIPAVCNEIDQTVATLVQYLSNFSPIDVLTLAYWALAKELIDKTTESSLDFKASCKYRMIDYVQSLYASIPISQQSHTPFGRAEYSNVFSLVEKIFTLISKDYMHGIMAYKHNTEPYEGTELYGKCLYTWCNTKGIRYNIHDIEFYNRLLEKFDDILINLYGCNSIDITQLLATISDNLQKKTIGSAQNFALLHKEFQNFVSSLTPENFDLNNNESVADWVRRKTLRLADKKFGEGWLKEQASLFGGTKGFEVHPTGNIPQKLIDDLSWCLGEEQTFFQSEKEFKGWPLKEWPINKRPFIAVKGISYCFDLYALTDNLYRSLRSCAFKAGKNVKNQWAARQGTAMEDLTMEVFAEILPGATYYNNIFYRTPTGKNKQMQWAECDGLFIYDDCIFIIEVKSKLYTYTSPATDFESHIKSVNEIAIDTAKQGGRFLRYLESAPNVEIFRRQDRNYIPTASLKHSSFRNKFICAISFDSFTHITAQLKRFKYTDFDGIDYPFWAIPLSDLFVIRDIFQNPLTFIHFLEQRIKAINLEHVAIDDEIDHLGLYLEHNLYSDYLNKPKSFGIIHGYRDQFDSYYHALLKGEKPQKPIQRIMPSVFQAAFDIAANKKMNHRSLFAKYLLDFDGETREKINNFIETEIKEAPLRGRPLYLTTPSPHCIILTCSFDGAIPRNARKTLQHAFKSLLASKAEAAGLIELVFDTNKELKDVHFIPIKRSDIPAFNLEKYSEEAEDLRVLRVRQQRLKQGKLGRNTPCPCGSGKKFKHCCMETPS